MELRRSLSHLVDDVLVRIASVDTGLTGLQSLALQSELLALSKVDLLAFLFGDTGS